MVTQGVRPRFPLFSSAHPDPKIDSALRFIDAYWDENWTSPTVRDLCAYLGYSSSSSGQQFLGKLRRLGLIEVKHVGGRVLYRRRVL